MKEKMRRALPWAVLAMCYLFTVGVYAMYGSHNIDSDTASEMVLAQLLNEEGGFLSENWLYSTELRVVSPVPVYQLGLLLFPGSWHMARTFSIAIILAGVAASFIYMGRGAGLRDSAVYAAGLILLPVSQVQSFLFSFGGFYTAYVIFACLLVGLVLRMDRRRGRALRTVLLVGLGFFCGLSGVRMPMICGAPLMLACALELWSALRRSDSLREAMASEQTPIAVGATLSTAAMLAGYLVNTRVFEKIYTFASYHTLMLGEVNLDLFIEQIPYFFAYFGLNTNLPMLSVSALVDLLMVGVCVLMGIALCALLVRRRELSPQRRILTYFAALALVLGMVLTGTTNKATVAYCVGYYIMGVLTPVMLLMLYLERMPCKMRGVRTAATLAVCAVFALESVSFVHSYVRKEKSMHEDAANWLVENGYTAGFASFWYGNTLTEASNGQLDLYVFNKWDDRELYKWLQRKDHMEDLPEGPVFVYLGVEYYEMDVACAQEDHLVHYFPEYDTRIYRYESAQEVMDLQREAAKRRAEHAAPDGEIQ